MKKILVIEDEQQLLRNILKILKSEGFIAIGADNGKAGVSTAVKEIPDLIVCDVMMPEMDGYQVLGALQKEPKTALIPFIFLSAKAERTHQRLGINLGADDYLTKPFDADELIAAIDGRFRKQEIWQSRMSELSETLTQVQRLLSAKEQAFSAFETEVRGSIANINMALSLLGKGDQNREGYIQILKTEFAREISLLNQMTRLQEVLTPANVDLLRQFNLLQQPPISE